jgi:hypothetical protein
VEELRKLFDVLTPAQKMQHYKLLNFLTPYERAKIKAPLLDPLDQLTRNRKGNGNPFGYPSNNENEGGESQRKSRKGKKSRKSRKSKARKTRRY